MRSLIEPPRRDAQDSVIGGEHHICATGLGTCHVERIPRAETKLAQLMTSSDRRGLELHALINGGEERFNPFSSVQITNASGLGIQHIAAKPKPAPLRSHTQNEQNCFCLKSDARLRLVIKRSVQAASVQIDSHWCGL